MYSKLSRKDKEDKLARLKRQKDNIEFDDDPDLNKRHPESKKMITAWRKYTSMSESEQIRIDQAWDKYYEEVKASPIYALFQEQKKAIENNDWARVKDLARQARQMRENNDVTTLQKPTSIDPWEFNRGWVKAYKDCEAAIKELNNDLNMPETEETREVWYNQK